MKPAWAALIAVAGAPVGAEVRFQDRAAALPVEHVYAGGWEHFVGGGVAVVDCNGDTRPEIFAAGGEAPARLFQNKIDGESWAFAQADFPETQGVTGAYPMDIDSDGAMDLVVLRVGENILFRGDGACGFTRANETWGFDGGDAWSTAFTATWEAGQSWPTLVVGNYVDRADPEGPFEACDDNQLHRPAKTGGYKDATPLSPGFCALSMLISDWQRSGAPELRISNDRHYYVRGGYEEMWRLDPLQPRTEADGWDRVSLWGMGIASQDLGGDGYPDVMLTSMGDQLLQFNEAGVLRSAPYSQGSYATRPHAGEDGRPSTGWHAEFGDVDNDGRPDLFIAKGNVDQMPGLAIEDPNNLLRQAEDGTFEEVSVAAGVATTARSRGAALADFDGDGRLDLVVVNRRAPMELYQNVTAKTGNWLTVDLHQEGANPNAIGAWVEMRTNGAVQTQEVTIGGGHVGGQAVPLHFGLGAATGAEMRVTWPDGQSGAWTPVEAGQALRIAR